MNFIEVNKELSRFTAICRSVNSVIVSFVDAKILYNMLSCLL